MASALKGKCSLCSSAPSVSTTCIASCLLVYSMEEVLADSDSDLEDDIKQQKGKETRKVLRQQSQAWLKEGEGDEPLNFLDPNVAQRVLGKEQFDSGTICLFSFGKVGDHLC